MRISLFIGRLLKYLLIGVTLLSLQLYASEITHTAHVLAKKTGVFSNLNINLETGDITGIEVIISKCQSGYCATFQSAEGEPRPPVIAKISISKDNKLELFLNEEYGYKGKFFGNITNEGIVGGFEGGALAPDGSHIITLKRTSSFWGSH